MELIDILNGDGTLTGKQATINEIHEKGLWHRAEHIWFVNDNKDILVQKRSKTVKHWPGFYDISAAGHVSAGNTPTQGALKEVEGELGIKLQEKDLLKIGELIQEHVEPENNFVNREWNNIYVVRKNIPLNEFEFQDGEVESVKYISLKDFKKWISSGAENFVHHKEEFAILIDYLEKRIT